MESFLKGFKLLILQGREFLSHSNANAENKHIKSWKSSPKHRNLLELELELPWLQCFGRQGQNAFLSYYYYLILSYLLAFLSYLILLLPSYQKK